MTNSAMLSHGEIKSVDRVVKVGITLPAYENCEDEKRACPVKRLPMRERT